MDTSGDYSKGHFVRRALFGIEGNKFEFLGWCVILFPTLNYFVLGWSIWTWLALLTLAILIFVPWVKRQHTLFVRGQLAHRHSPRLQVVYSPNDTKCFDVATEVVAEAEKAGYNAKMCTVLDYPAYHCLNNALILIFVINDSEETQRNFSDDRYLAQWMHAEIQTRVFQSDYLGYRANIVYTREGQRRNCFLRLKYSVISFGENSHPNESPFSDQIDSNFSEFGAYRILPIATESDAKEWIPKLVKEMDAVVVNPNGPSIEMQNKVKNAEPLLGTEKFIEYLLACPCCKTYDLERTRERPSVWRLSLLDFILFGLFSSKGHNPIGRFTKGYIEGKLFPINRIKYLYYYISEYMYPIPAQTEAPPPLTTVLTDVKVNCQLGRKTADDKVDRDDEIPDGDFIVNPSFKLISNYSVPKGKEYIHEFTHGNSTVAVITDPGTKVPYYYSVPESAVGVLSELRPGSGCSASTLQSLQPAVRRALYDSSIITRNFQVENEISKWNAIVLETSMDLQKKGWCVFREIFHPYFFRFIREYYAGIVGEFYRDSPKGSKKFYTWNDEPLARYFNYHFTELVSRITGEKLCHSSLALSIWIHEGPGFLIHTDTNPPFDITLDVVIDHQGMTGRSLNFVKKPKAGEILPSVETLNLKIGEAILFKGSEIPHFGGNLPENHSHTVMLFTWEYTRD